MPTPVDERVTALIEAVRRQHVPDFRSGVFDVVGVDDNGVCVVRGQSTDDAAVSELMRRIHAMGVSSRDEVVRLPDETVAAGRHALVRAAIAPVYAEPKLPAPQISQVVLGMRVELLARHERWLRIRGEDGYLGWAYEGYFQHGGDDWAFAWERNTTGESVVSLGAELLDDESRVMARLPWGARFTRRAGAFQLPDGRSGAAVHGDIVDVDLLADRFPPHGESIARTARRWLGAPYLWGGVTLHGVDCSGFSQAVMWVHGVALPRDSDLQSRVGIDVSSGSDFAAFRPGDLLYFAENGERVSHVAISLGGSSVIHSSIGNGGVALNDLAGDQEIECKLAAMLVSARRMLPD